MLLEVVVEVRGWMGKSVVDDVRVVEVRVVFNIPVVLFLPLFVLNHFFLSWSRLCAFRYLLTSSVFLVLPFFLYPFLFDMFLLGVFLTFHFFLFWKGGSSPEDSVR